MKYLILTLIISVTVSVSFASRQKIAKCTLSGIEAEQFPIKSGAMTIDLHSNEDESVYYFKYNAIDADGRQVGSVGGPITGEFQIDSEDNDASFTQDGGESLHTVFTFDSVQDGKLKNAQLAGIYLKNTDGKLTGILNAEVNAKVECKLF